MTRFNTETYDEIKETILKILEDMTIGKKNNFNIYANIYKEELQQNSVDTTMLLLYIEKKFGITIHFAEMKDIRTIEDIIKLVCRKKDISIPQTKHISFVETDEQSIKFVQDGKTLPLQDPRIQLYLKKLQEILITNTK